MITRIINFTRKDLANSLRNNMVLYMVIFPILLALGLKLFMPSVTEMETTIAVDKAVGQQVIQGLDEFGKVEIYNSRQEVEERVEALDDISGIVKEGDEYVVVMEGNEPEAGTEMSHAVMNMVLSDEPGAEFTHKSMEKENSSMTEISASLLLLTAIMIAGMVSALNIIEEKETKAINALSVSPIKLPEFIASHLLVSLITSLILAFAAIITLLGLDINYLQIILAMVCSFGVGVGWGFLVGGIADNLIAAIGVIKSTALFLIGIPMASIYVPASFRWALYPFPNYWAFESYRNIFNGNQQWIGFNNSCLITLGFSLVVILLLAPFLRKRLNLR